MSIGTTKHACVGNRVQIPAYTDLWMRGARFGTVERVIVGKGNFIDPRDPRGWRVLSGNLTSSTIARVCYRYEAESGE